MESSAVDRDQIKIRLQLKLGEEKPHPPGTDVRYIDINSNPPQWYFGSPEHGLSQRALSM